MYVVCECVCVYVCHLVNITYVKQLWLIRISTNVFYLSCPCGMTVALVCHDISWMATTHCT